MYIYYARMVSLVIKGDNPIVDKVVNNEVHLTLSETGVITSGDVAIFTNGINGLKVDKYGRVHTVTAGSTDQIVDTELFQLHGNSGHVGVKGRNNINILGDSNEIKTTVNNNGVLLQLANIGSKYTFDLSIVDGVIVFYDIITKTWLNNLSLKKNIHYTFKQFNANAVPNNSFIHALSVRYKNGGAYTGDVKYYINHSGPYDYITYETLFSQRSIDSFPYFKLFLSDIEIANDIEIHSQHTNILTTPLKVVYDLTSGLRIYANINSLSVDNTGRIHGVDILDNDMTNMSSFNISDNFDTLCAVTNKSNLHLKGKRGQIVVTNITPSAMEIKLEETDVLKTLNTLLEIRIMYSQISVYNPITFLQSSIQLIRGTTYTFDQSALTYQDGGAIGISTSSSTIEEYISSNVVYQYSVDGGVLTAVTRNKYTESFKNNTITNRRIVFTPTTTTPTKLYLYSVYSNTMNKLSITVTDDTQIFSNIRSLTVDKYGRINSIVNDIPSVDINITFELILNKYSNFTLVDVINYKVSISSLLSVPVGSVTILQLNYGVGGVFIYTKVGELTDKTSAGVKSIIDRVNINASIEQDFVQIFNNNGLTAVTKVTVNSQSIISDASAYDYTDSILFSGNSGSQIPILKHQTLNLVSDTLTITGDGESRTLSLNLNPTGVITSTDSSKLFSNANITNFTVDKYGRIKNITTNDVTQFVAAGSYGPGISNLTVDATGRVASITSVDFQQNIFNVNTVLTDKINIETSRAAITEGPLSELKTTSKTSLVNAINDNFDSIISNTQSLGLIGSLSDTYTATNTLTKRLGDLNKIPQLLTLLEYLNRIGDVSLYTTTSTLSSSLGNISNLPYTVAEYLNKLGDLTSSTSLSDLTLTVNVLTANAPSSLNTLSKLAGAVNNNHLFASDIMTLVNSKQSIITGSASSITSLNLTSDRVLVSDELGKIITSSVTGMHLNQLSGVSSNIQAQLNSKQSVVTGTLSDILVNNLSNNRALVTSSTGKIEVSSLSVSELNTLIGVTSNIQTQLNSKQPTVTGTLSNILVNNLPTNKVMVTDDTGKIIASTITGTELSHLSGVVNNIHAQIKDIAPTSGTVFTYSYDGLYPLNSSKVDIGVYGAASLQPFEVPNEVALGLYYSIGVAKVNYSALAGITDFSQPWRITHKLQFLTSVGNAAFDGIEIGLSNNALDESTTTLVVLRNGISFQTSIANGNGEAITFVSEANSYPVSVSTIDTDRYVVVDRQINKVDIYIYDNNETEMYKCSVTSPSFNCVYPVRLSFKQRMTKVTGILIEKNHSVNKNGALALEELIALKDFNQVDSKKLKPNSPLSINAFGKLESLDVSNTEIRYLKNVTGDIQTQLNTKQAADTNIVFLNGVTSNIQSQLNSKQNSLTNLQHLDNVTSNIQTQLNSKQNVITNAVYLDGLKSNVQWQINNVSPSIYSSLMSIDRVNIALTCSPDSTLPSFINNSAMLSHSGFTMWGIYANKVNLTTANVWRVIFKQLVTYHNVDTADKIIVSFNSSTSSIGWTSGDLHLGGGETLNDAFYYGTTNPSYTEITKLITGQYVVSLYNHELTLMRTTTVSVLNQTPNDLIFSIHYPHTKFHITGVLIERDITTISPYQLQHMINMRDLTISYSTSAILVDVYSQFSEYLDYYVSLNIYGTFDISGLKSTSSSFSVKFSIQNPNVSTRTLYDNITSAPTSSGRLKNEDLITWFNPQSYSYEPTSQAYIHNTLLLTGIDTSLYVNSGFTVIYFIKGFTYVDPILHHGYNANNIMSMYSDDSSNADIIQSRAQLSEYQYEYRLRTSSFGNAVEESSSSLGVQNGPRLKWENTDDFKYGDTKYNPPQQGLMRSKPNDIWFMAHTYGYGLSDGERFGQEINMNNNVVQTQLFYKRAGFDKLNYSCLWKPTWPTLFSDQWAKRGLSKTFTTNTWLLFGSNCGGGDTTYPVGGLTHNNWKSGAINSVLSETKEANVNISEIMIFNKILNHSEISQLSKLSPFEIKRLLKR